MSPKIWSLAAAVAALALYTPAHAESSEASFRITVYIPPLAAAMAARDNGAVGSWTVFKQGGGFMVDTTSDGDAGALTIHRGDRNRFNLIHGGRIVSPESVENNGGLSAVRFRGSDLAGDGAAPALLTFAAI